MTIVNKKCLDCGKDFEYDEKPGYPRKYCFGCSAERKKSFANKDKTPVARQGMPATAEKPMGKSAHATMYVSYAKDIFLGLLDADHRENQQFNSSELMKKAIELVKQARGGV